MRIRFWPAALAAAFLGLNHLPDAGAEIGGNAVDPYVIAQTPPRRNPSSQRDEPELDVPRTCYESVVDENCECMEFEAANNGTWKPKDCVAASFCDDPGTRC